MWTSRQEHGLARRTSDSLEDRPGFDLPLFAIRNSTFAIGAARPPDESGPEPASASGARLPPPAVAIGARVITVEEVRSLRTILAMMICPGVTTPPSTRPSSLSGACHRPGPHSVVPRATVGHGVGDGIQRFFSYQTNPKIPPGDPENADSRAKTNPNEPKTNPIKDPKTPIRTQTNPKRTHSSRRPRIAVSSAIWTSTWPRCAWPCHPRRLRTGAAQAGLAIAPAGRKCF